MSPEQASTQRNGRSPTRRAANGLIRVMAVALAQVPLVIGIAATHAAAQGNETVEVTAGDVILGPAYWQGSTQGDLTITVRNAKKTRATVEGVVFLPPETHLVSGSGSDGCSMATGLAYTCDLGQDAVPGRITIRVEIGAEAWRYLPLTGNVSATSSGASDTDGFSVAVPPGPPTPGFTLAATDMVVDPDPGNRASSVKLSVRFTNGGTTASTGAVEITTPPGADIPQVPSGCSSHRRLSANADRCELGNVAPSQEIQLTFEVLISEQAVPEIPLAGVVYGYLTPLGQGTLTIQAGYRIGLAAPTPGQASGSASPSVDAEALPPVSERTTIQPVRIADDGAFGNRVSALSLMGIAFGSVAVVGVLVVASLRRRMRDEVEAQHTR